MINDLDGLDHPYANSDAMSLELRMVNYWHHDPGNIQVLQCLWVGCGRYKEVFCQDLSFRVVIKKLKVNMQN